MNLTDVVKILKQTYNIEITPQGLYNWCKKYDLLKFRGKGRNLSVTSKKPKSPMQQAAERRKRELRKQRDMKKKGMGR